MSIDHGRWLVRTVGGADVRLRSGRIGLVSVDVTAPVRCGELHVTGEGVRMVLVLALDRLSTRNFIMERAAKSIVSRYDARDLRYDAVGPGRDAPWQVAGHAIAGSIDVELLLTVTPTGPSHDPMGEVEIVGSASLGTVQLPLPGLGTVEDFAFDVDARLALDVHPDTPTRPAPS